MELWSWNQALRSHPFILYHGVRTDIMARQAGTCKLGRHDQHRSSMTSSSYRFTQSVTNSRIAQSLTYVGCTALHSRNHPRVEVGEGPFLWIILFKKNEPLFFSTNSLHLLPAKFEFILSNYDIKKSLIYP